MSKIIELYRYAELNHNDNQKQHLQIQNSLSINLLYA